MQSLKDAWAKAEAIWNAAFSWVGAHPKTTIVAGVVAVWASGWLGHKL
jgi:hypothetical protein